MGVSGGGGEWNCEQTPRLNEALLFIWPSTDENLPTFFIGGGGGGNASDNEDEDVDADGDDINSLRVRFRLRLRLHPRTKLNMKLFFMHSIVLCCSCCTSLRFGFFNTRSLFSLFFLTVLLVVMIIVRSYTVLLDVSYE